ncbi:MAG: hypothetical protein ACTHN0_08565 [Aquihabitans sp.]
MNLTIVKTLTKGEQSLVMDTRPKKLDGLSEDQLLELHNRVRRSRNKYKKNARQGGARNVKAAGSRGGARKRNQDDARRREVFEDALARVSSRLAKAARKTADDLKSKRLAAAKKEKAARAKAKARAAEKAKTKKAASKPKPKAAARGKRTSTKTPVRKKAVAGQRATKARTNAKKGR